MSRSSRRLAAATLLATTISLNLVNSASAARPEPVSPIDPPITIAAADSCVDFDLMISSTAGKVRTIEFRDEGQNLVRLFQAFTGISYTYTNATSGKSITTKAGGSATSTVYGSDGTQTVTATGHNALIMFATDNPGPSVTAYQGKIVFKIDPHLVFTLESAKGASLDICKALAEL